MTRCSRMKRSEHSCGPVDPPANVNFDAYGTAIPVEDTRCHTQRYVRPIMATPYLAAWRNDHPFEPAGDAPVFITHQERPLQHATIYGYLPRIAKRAGITKKITPQITWL